jgi:hypothetical protein
MTTGQDSDGSRWTRTYWQGLKTFTVTPRSSSRSGERRDRREPQSRRLPMEARGRPSADSAKVGSGRVVRGRPGPPVARHWAAVPSQKETRGPPEGAYGEAPAQLVLRRGPDRRPAPAAYACVTSVAGRSFYSAAAQGFASSRQEPRT